ncbi:MAG: PEGA domain-containing protein [Myxococcales bacterium]
MSSTLASRAVTSRGLSVLTLLSALTTFPPVALAQTSDSLPATDAAPSPTLPLAESLTGDAKRDYELGRLLYDNGDFAGALLRFESARKASAEGRLWWNTAVCEKALRHYARAAAAMRAYLAENSERISQETRASARDFAQAAESLTAPLMVTSNVPGADLYLDLERIGPLPLREPARVDWGTHQILVKLSGYIGYTQTVTVAGSALSRVAAVLRPVVHEGRIVVRTGGTQAIWIDHKRVAWGSWEGPLSSGAHSLRVSGEGFKPYERQIVIIDDQTQGFDILLERGSRSAVPTWVWLVGGGVLAAGAVTGGYFVFKPDPARSPTPGSLATVQL